MSITEKILKFKKAGRPFWIFLEDGRKFGVLGNAWFSMHPSGKGTRLTIYCDEDEEYSIPVVEIKNVSLVKGTEAGI